MDNEYWIDEKGQKYEPDQADKYFKPDYFKPSVRYPSCGNCALVGYCRFCVKYPVI